jgi:mannose-6-phosphate isomerase
LLPIFRERVWGRKSLAPFFQDLAPAKPVGEVWFTSSENQTSLGERFDELLALHPEILGAAADPAHPGTCPLLVKLLFTTERLSVQVHPDDEYAKQRHGSLGKTEAWYVVDSQPPGEVGVGFRRAVTPEQLKAAARSGEIAELLDWRKVSAGATVFVPAGTVHAIGAGLTICEIQENSDITYRLYDYGRDRELHLEDGIKVSRLSRHDFGGDPRVLADGRDELVTSPYFRIERLRPSKAVHVGANLEQYLLLVCLKGRGSVAGEAFAAGQCWIAPAHGCEVLISGSGSEWILTYTSREALADIQVE